MTKEAILKKAIEKAVDNGWKVLPEMEAQYSVHGWDNTMNWLVEKIIFSHSFAKAFFGKWNLKNPDYPDKLEDEYGVPYLTKWQYHLQQMVLEENPIEYLAKFLKGK